MRLVPLINQIKDISELPKYKVNPIDTAQIKTSQHNKQVCLHIQLHMDFLS